MYARMGVGSLSTYQIHKKKKKGCSEGYLWRWKFDSKHT